MRAAFLFLLLLPVVATGTGAEAPVRLILVLEGDAPLDGVDVLHRYGSFPGALVLATPREAARLPGVVAVFPDEPLEHHLDLAVPVLGLAGPGAPGGSGAGVVVAVVDSGIDALHPGLRGRIQNYAVTESGVAPSTTPGDATGHGTLVAGVLAGNGAESPGNRYRGVAPGASVAALDLGRSFTTDNALRAFDWLKANHAAMDIRIVTCSWGRTAEVDGRFEPDAPIVRASSALAAEGVLVVFSAGNRGGAMAPEPLNPDVLAVGATDAGGRLASFSSRGPALDRDGHPLPYAKPDLVAVGANVVSARSLAATTPAAERDRTLAPQFYAQASGTSLAAPQVAGAAALLLEQDPSLSRADLARLLTASARDLATPGVDDATGAGLLDARAALRLAAEGVLAGREEREAAFAFPADVVAAPRLLTRLAPAPGVATEGLLRGYVPALPGSARLRAEVAWTSAAAAGFEARLVDPDGRDAGALSGSGGRLALEVADPAPGVWTVTAAPTSGFAQASLTLGGVSDLGRTYAALADAVLPAGDPFEEDVSLWALGGVALATAAAGVTLILLRRKFA